MSDELKLCPFCGAKYPECGEDCFNYKIAECVMAAFKQSGGRSVPKDELEAAWNTRATVQREPVKVKLPTIHKRWMNHEDKEQAELVYLSDVIAAFKSYGVEVVP